MKKKIGILAVVLCLVGIGNIQINAAAPEDLPGCDNCLIYGGLTLDTHQASAGDCYAGEEWCGSLATCYSGVFICGPISCRTTYIGCNIVNPD